MISAFLAASRRGDFEALLGVLDPDVILRADGAEIRGAALLAERAIKGGARAAQPALINGEIGVVIAPRGKLLMVLRFTIVEGKITAMESITDPQRLSSFELAILGDN